AGCKIIPAGICIEYADYEVITFLPPSQGGYLLTFSICCRNLLIVNIPKPLNTGYVYNTNIPSHDTAGNSSPFFQDPPPVLLCLNQPFNFSLNVLESDGDSLHYELCDIYDMYTYPAPINFIPPYSSQMPMAASPPFSIDPQ